MDHRSTENFYVVLSPGLEQVCARELNTLGISPAEIAPGGISFQGKLRELYLANLHLRTASRILVRFASFQARAFPDLYRKTAKLPWGRFIKPDSPVAFRITCHASRLNQTTRIAETLESSVNRTLGRTTNPADGEPQLIVVRIVDDLVTLSIDSSGELLHRRGYRRSTTAAPLRETLAAGALMLLGWDGTQPLADPLCGSGSFPLEGALLAMRRAPGLSRNFAFMKWPGYREGLWTLLCSEARRQEIANQHPITGSDENLEAVTAARENCERSGLAGQLTLDHIPLSGQSVQGGEGLVICNPPYGKRLALGENAAVTYAELGRELQRAYPGWQKALICPDPKLAKATGLPLSRIAELNNGGLSVTLFATT